MKTDTPEKYFINQLFTHKCQLPQSEVFHHLKKTKKWKNYLLISERSLESYLKAKNLSRIYYEKLRQLRTTHIIVHPYSKFRKMWIIWMSFVFLLAFIVLPFFAAFHGPIYAKQLVRLKKSFTLFWVVLYVVLIVQVACLLDVVVNFFTGYTTATPEEMVIQPWRILSSYLYKYFIIDLASSIPFDFILIMVMGVEWYSEISSSYIFVLTMLPFLKFLRLYTFYKYVSVVYSIFSSSDAIFNVIWFTSLFFLFVHWSTCINVIFSQLTHYEFLFDDKSAAESTCWIFRHNCYRRNIIFMYGSALYRSVSCLTKLGFEVFENTDIHDKIISAVLGIFGSVYLLILLVVFLQATSATDKAKLSYAEIMDQVEEYMELKRFPKGLKKKVREYYLCLYQRHYVDENAIINLASDTLRKEIFLRIYHRLIENVNIFSGLSQNVTIQILKRLKPEIYREGEVAFKDGDYADCMYFVSFGTFALYRKDGVEIGHMDDGHYFGEISLLYKINRFYTAVAIETSLVYRLDSLAFDTTIRSDKALISKLEKVIEAWVKKVQIDIRLGERKNFKEFKKRLFGDDDEDALDDGD